MNKCVSLIWVLGVFTVCGCKAVSDARKTRVIYVAHGMTNRNQVVPWAGEGVKSKNLEIVGRDFRRATKLECCPEGMFQKVEGVAGVIARAMYPDECFESFHPVYAQTSCDNECLEFVFFERNTTRMNDSEFYIEDISQSSNFRRLERAGVDDSSAYATPLMKTRDLRPQISIEAQIK